MHTSLWLGSLACREDATQDTSTSISADAPVAAIDADHPTVVHVTWTTADAATSWVEFGPDDAFGKRSPAAEGTAHEHRMLGLKVGGTYVWRVANEVGGSVTYSDTYTVQLPPPPPELPTLDLVVDEPDATMHGNYLVVIGADEANVAYQTDTVFYIGILDDDADFVWYHILPPGYGTNGAYPWSDGESLFWLEVPILREEQDGDLRWLTLDGTDLGSSLAVTGHHGQVEIAGGRVAHLGRRFFPDQSGGASSTDRIMVVDANDPQGLTSTEQFDYYDDWWGGSFDYYWLGPCVELWQSAFGYAPNCEMTHSNSIGYVASENAIYAYSRLLDTVLKVDADTGALEWILGGPKSEFTFPDGTNVQPTADQPRLWSGGHFSQVFADGLVMFDNGLKYTPQVSSLLEVKWDEEAGTVEEVFRFYDPDGGFTLPLGDAKKLQSGNYVGSWMSLGKINEVTPDGRIVWELRSESSFRRVAVLANLYDLTETYEQQ